MRGRQPLVHGSPEQVWCHRDTPLPSLPDTENNPLCPSLGRESGRTIFGNCKTKFHGGFPSRGVQRVCRGSLRWNGTREVSLAPAEEGLKGTKDSCVSRGSKPGAASRGIAAVKRASIINHAGPILTTPRLCVFPWTRQRMASRRILLQV